MDTAQRVSNGENENEREGRILRHPHIDLWVGYGMRKGEGAYLGAGYGLRDWQNPQGDPWKAQGGEGMGRWLRYCRRSPEGRQRAGKGLPEPVHIVEFVYSLEVL